MKLQLSPGQASAFAHQIGSYQDLAISTQAVLDAFHAASHDPYTRRDVVAVLVALGSPADPILHIENGVEGWRIVNPLVKGERSSKGRGFYTQNNRPAIASTPKTSEEIEAEQAELAARGIAIEAIPGLVWLPESVEANPELEGWYADDEGLRQIAVSQSKCFGNFSAGSSSCQACPLSRWCSSSGMACLDDIASELDAGTEKEIREAERAAENARLAAEAAAKAAARTGGSPAPSKPSSIPSSPSSPASAPVDGWPAGYQEVPLPFDGVCSECEGLIKGGEQGVHLTGVGMFHIQCARDRIAKG